MGSLRGGQEPARGALGARSLRGEPAWGPGACAGSLRGGQEPARRGALGARSLRGEPPGPGQGKEGGRGQRTAWRPSADGSTASLAHRPPPLPPSPAAGGVYGDRHHRASGAFFCSAVHELFRQGEGERPRGPPCCLLRGVGRGLLGFLGPLCLLCPCPGPLACPRCMSTDPFPALLPGPRCGPAAHTHTHAHCHRHTHTHTATRTYAYTATDTLTHCYTLLHVQATPLSTHTVLKLSKELPVVVEYHIPEVGRLAFYLAPKIEEEEMNDA